ncbi:MAG: hypothetical protein MUF72_16470 [Elainella sp. Prado103]|nr:hypothetical protein [Elainella sp. Prado103]
MAKQAVWMIGGLTLIGWFGCQSIASARPAAIFDPYIYQIRQELPPNFEMRLPAEVLLTAGPGLEPEELIIKLLPTRSPSRLTIGLFTCDRSPFPCLVGGFTVESSQSESAQRSLDQHRQLGSPITLAEGIQGYMQDGPLLMPASDFSTLMWEQRGMVYTLSFLAAERENILTMGRSMANQLPLRSIQPHSAQRPGNL